MVGEVTFCVRIESHWNGNGIYKWLDIDMALSFPQQNHIINGIYSTTETEKYEHSWIHLGEASAEFLIDSLSHVIICSVSGGMHHDFLPLLINLCQNAFG